MYNIVYVYVFEISRLRYGKWLKNQNNTATAVRTHPPPSHLAKCTAKNASFFMCFLEQLLFFSDHFFKMYAEFYAYSKQRGDGK